MGASVGDCYGQQSPRHGKVGGKINILNLKIQFYVLNRLKPLSQIKGNFVILIFLKFVISMKVSNKMQLYSLIYYSQSALHISGEVFAHHQEHLTVFTVSGSVHTSCCWLVSLREAK
jgi:hypothetical protein